METLSRAQRPSHGLYGFDLVENEEESRLFGASIQSSSSMLSSSMMYSVDDSPVHYNPQTIHEGTFLTQALESDNDSLSSDNVSEQSSTFQGDLYFSNLPDEPSVESDHIFTDDLSQESSREDDASKKNNSQSVRVVSPEDKQQQKRETKQTTDSKLWEKYNHERGRIVAQQLLRPYKMGSEGSTASISDESDTSKSIRHRPGFLKRIMLKKLTLPSQCALDQQQERRPTVSDLGFSAYHDAPSAVLTRNKLVDFNAWENLSTCSVIPEDAREDDLSTILSEKSVKSILYIKSVSLMAREFITAPPSKKRSLREQLLEPRLTSEQIADELGVDAHELLGHIRGRAGIIEDLVDTPGIPWIHLYESFWIPHYEEWVVSNVLAFAKRLRNPARTSL